MTVGRSTSPTHLQGATAEDLAVAFLVEHGLTILHQNYHSRYGEIDIIAYQEQSAQTFATLIFIEVKSTQKNNAQYGLTVERVTASKQKKMIQTAYLFLEEFQSLYNDVDLRFDIVTVHTSKTIPAKVQIDWFIHAFLAE